MKAAILLNGCEPSQRLLTLARDAQLIICADGAGEWALRAGLRVDAIVGDMDSISPQTLLELEAQGADIIRYERDKNETDACLAVDEALSRWADEIVILGGTGTRLDHTLGNIMLLKRCAMAGVRAILADEHNQCIAVRKSFSFTGREGDTISVLPMSETLRLGPSQGLKWQLDGLKLKQQYPRGISNCMVAQRAAIAIKSGWALIIFATD